MHLKYITFGIIILLCARSAHAATYTIDKREYVSNWCDAPYNKIVAFFPPSPGKDSYYPIPECTGQYVAPNIILTALHCVQAYDSTTFQVSNCKNPDKRYDVEIISQGTANNIGDWALLRIQDPAGYSDEFFEVSPTTPENSDINNAGWGNVRRLSDQEITEIRNILKQYMTVNPNPKSFDAIYDYVAQQIDIAEPKLSGRADYPTQLKVNTKCEITGTYYREQCKNPYIDPKICQTNQRFFTTNCNTQSGNSGGPYFLGNTLYGIVSRGMADISTDNNLKKYDLGQKNNTFYDALVTARATSPATKTTSKPSQVAQTTQNNETPLTPVKETSSQNTQQKPKQTTVTPTSNPAPQITAAEITASETAILNEITNIDNASSTDVLNIIIKMADINQLRQQYEKAKAREQSVPNKLLGGLTMAATGIGGMQLASGIAEQRADEAAERDMQAYLATFRCDYGAGRNIVGGETGIELPGGNDLTPLVSEYRALAADIAQRKAALGMTPGIEVEAVFDKSETGLYDNVGIGTQPGAFTSLSRALLDENSDDAKAWAEQKQSAKNKTKTGAITAGVGAIGGTIGNLIINKDTNKNTDKPNNKTTDDDITKTKDANKTSNKPTDDDITKTKDANKTNNKPTNDAITKNNVTDDNLLIQVATTCFSTTNCGLTVAAFPQTDNQRTATDTFLKIIDNKRAVYEVFDEEGFKTYATQGYKMPLDFASDLLSLRNAINSHTLNWGAQEITFDDQEYPAFLLEAEVTPTSQIGNAYQIRTDSEFDYISIGNIQTIQDQIQAVVKPLCPDCNIEHISGHSGFSPIPGGTSLADDIFIVTSGNELKYVFRPMYDTRYDKSTNTFLYYQYYRISKPLVK
ncbi:MAG: S1 family peptidase [Muribaculaceae bacterium]|nr:S1 family peptidase [Muribaculaceae bacterium]